MNTTLRIKSSILIQLLQFLSDNFTTLLTHGILVRICRRFLHAQTSTAYRSLVNGTTSEDAGAANPLILIQIDGILDGWEFYHARWSLFDESWTLNPVNEGDQVGDPDGDGMNNWEEYNVIDGILVKLTTLQQFLNFTYFMSGENYLQPLVTAESTLSFGTSSVRKTYNSEAILLIPMSPIPMGMVCSDGIELMFTRWNATDETWTLIH